MFDEAREYMARAVPWPQDGDLPFWVNVHWTVKVPDRDKPFWSGRACRSVDEAVSAIKWALSLPETRDVYLCQSGQRVAVEKISKAGKRYFMPQRTQGQVAALKSLFLDIDVKGGANGYENVTQAVTAFGDFLAKSGMPKPTMIVSSGGGLHIYWVLVRALSLHEWQPLANALANAVKTLGLKCDTGCTIDSARVLRIPDTFNRKLDTPRPVRLAGKRLDFDYAVERIQSALEPYQTIGPSDGPMLPPRPALPGLSDLSAGIEVSKAPPVDLDLVAPDCGFIREALDTGGADLINPLWNLTTLISTFTAGAAADAHRMADKHPGYTPETTDELFERKSREKEQKNLGWPSCRTIRLAGCNACETCPHKDAGKSPLNFQQRPALPAPTPAVTPGSLIALPQGYAINATNMVCHIRVDDLGNQSLMPIMDYPMSNPWLQRDPWVLNFETTTHTGHAKQISIPFINCSTREGIPKALSLQGLVIQESQHKAVREFIVSWITTLQKSKQTIVSSSPYGWVMKNGAIEGFCYGGKVWMPTGDRASAPGDPVMARQYTPSGELKPWVKASQMVTSQKRPELDAILASAFGAALVKFTGQSGLLMSCYSLESGIGKTTALKIAQAVWGDPVKAMQGLTDTQLSVLRKIGEIQSLPLYWDELKTEDDTRKFVNLTFQLSSGKEKARLTADVQQRDPGTWQTMMVSASNESLLDFITSRTKMTTAGLYRVFEYEVTPGKAGQIQPSDAQRIISKLHDNYGLIGLEYAKWLGANHVAIDAEVEVFQKALEKEIKAQNDERFWTAAITCVCMGAKFANRLGFTAIDEAALKAFMLTTLSNMRAERNKQPVDMRNVMNVTNVLAQYLNSMRARHTMRTNRIHIARGKPAAGSIVVVSDTSRLESIFVHIGVDDKLLRISSTQLSDWLQEAGYSRHLFTRALESEMGSKTINGRIGSGTTFAGATEYLIEIHLAGTPLANFLDEA